MADPRLEALAAAMLRNRQGAFPRYRAMVGQNAGQALAMKQYEDDVDNDNMREMSAQAGESLPIARERVGNSEVYPEYANEPNDERGGPGRFAGRRARISDEEMMNNISDNMGAGVKSNKSYAEDTEETPDRIPGYERSPLRDRYPSEGRDILPNSVAGFRKKYGRDPATDTEVEFYYGVPPESD